MMCPQSFSDKTASGCLLTVEEPIRFRTKRHRRKFKVYRFIDLNGPCPPGCIGTQ